MRSLTEQEISERFSFPQLQELATLGALQEEALQDLLREGRVLELETDDTLFRAGSKPTAFYVILQGQISVHRQYEGQAMRIRTHKRGEQIGFAAIIALHDRRGTAIADQQTVVLEISTEHFQQLYADASEEFAVLMMNLARGMARTINAMGADIAELRGRN